MTEEAAVVHRSRPRGRAAPEVVAPSSRVNIALPFSAFHVEEASRELAELAAIVAQLTAMVEKSVPDLDVHALRQRAEALALRLR